MSFEKITSKSEYIKALRKIDELIGKNPIKGSEIYLELDKLGELVVAYEEIHYPIEYPIGNNK